MNRITSFLASALFCALILAAPQRAEAQSCSGTSTSQSCQWTASVTILATLSCSVTQSFSFGSWPSSAGIVAATELNSGRILCTTNPGSNVAVSFVLPSVLTGPAGSVPILFGNESARLYNAAGSSGPVTSFNPATGFAGFASSTGNVTLTLGENGPGNPPAEVQVNLSGASAGTFTGVITATIALQ